MELMAHVHVTNGYVHVTVLADPGTYEVCTKLKKFVCDPENFNC